jgi:hypothetical protein
LQTTLLPASVDSIRLLHLIRSAPSPLLVQGKEKENKKGKDRNQAGNCKPSLSPIEFLASGSGETTTRARPAAPHHLPPARRPCRPPEDTVCWAVSRESPSSPPTETARGQSFSERLIPGGVLAGGSVPALASSVAGLEAKAAVCCIWEREKELAACTAEFGGPP